MFICPKRVPAFSLSKEGMCLKHMERWMESPWDWHLEPARCFRMKSKRLSAALSLGPPSPALSVLLLMPCGPSCRRLLARLAADASGPTLGSLAGEVSPPSCLLPHPALSASFSQPSLSSRPGGWACLCSCPQQLRRLVHTLDRVSRGPVGSSCLSGGSRRRG